jgi:hypothetical protein
VSNDCAVCILSNEGLGWLCKYDKSVILFPRLNVETFNLLWFKSVSISTILPISLIFLFLTYNSVVSVDPKIDGKQSSTI